jgi:hypothetical protein
VSCGPWIGFGLADTLDLILGLDGMPPLFTDTADMFGIEGPRIYLLRILGTGTSKDTHSMVWDDGLMCVSAEVWELLQ